MSEKKQILKKITKLKKQLAVLESTLPKCKAKIWHGPGHQSGSQCDLVGPHRQHVNYIHDLYWSKKVAFSGYFDESPEYSQ